MSENGQLVLWSLWSRDRSGKPQDVYSHLTALSLKELSDANPARLDLTVPCDFRRGIPRILVLHKAQLTPREIIRERGYAVTTPIERSQTWPVPVRRSGTSLQKRFAKAKS